jgi:hypothetical protein
MDRKSPTKQNHPSIQLALPNTWRGGRASKNVGQDLVEENNRTFVATMRRRAVDIAMAKGRVTSDDLRRFAFAEGIKPDHPNAWGAVFRGHELVEIGRTKSRLTSNHHREIRVWGLSQDESAFGAVAS